MGPSNRYEKGRRFEYRVKRLFESRGWVVLRCAASRPFDLIALKRGETPILIECKISKYLPKNRKKRLRELAEKAGATFLFINKEFLRNLRKGFRKRGEILLDFSVLKGWDREVKLMSAGRRGRPFTYSDSLIRLLASIRLLFHLPYRQLEGFTRGLSKYTDG